MKLLKSHFASEKFIIQSNDVYYRRLSANTDFSLGTVDLDATAHFLLSKTLHAKIIETEDLNWVGYYLHNANLYDMCLWLMAHYESSDDVSINDKIYQYYFENNIDDTDYAFDNAIKLFYRFRKNLEKNQKNQKNIDFYLKNEEKGVLELLDSYLIDKVILLKKIAALFRIEETLIPSKSRLRSVSNARNVYVFVLRNMGMSYQEIANEISRTPQAIPGILKKIKNDIKIRNGTGLRAKSILKSLFSDTL